ncbi:MAG: hypothetical protein FJ041_07870, partial [Candidatus Cloacimonetes bacterium]|nr:hypothetical protein [Candidatus Cloacimonadota bacterium]
MFRYLIVLFIVLPISLLSVTLNFNISNQDIRYNPQINGFDRDSLTDWVFISTPGCYRLPVKTVKVVLPPDAIDISYSYTVNSVTVFSGKAPALSTPFSDGDRVLTSKPSLQPNEYLIYQGIGKWGDVQYARFTIIPALYNSTAESYDIARQIYLSVSYNTASEQTSLSNRIPQLLMQDSSFINRESIINWYRQSNMRTYDYLVVTTPALFNAAQPLVTFRQNQGLVTAFADINQILASTPGANPAEKLRNYLISEYSALPFTYLLLIGDIDVVPIAYLTPEPDGMDTVPSDFYYSDLSSNFDSDNDGKLGEYNTGMDFSPELAVGRIPWNNALTVAQICTRIVIFESSNQPWKQKTLLPSAILNYADEIPNIGWERTDGATFSEYCKATVLSNYQNTTLYEQMGLLPSYPSDYPLQADTLATLINTQSWGIVNWSAHGSSHYSARKVWMYDANNDNIPNGNEMQWFFMVGLD